MALNYYVTQSAIVGTSTLGRQRTLTGDQDIRLSITDKAIGTNTQYSIAFDKDRVVVFYAISDVDVTLKFNSSGSPAPQIDLTADVPYIFCNDDGRASEFAADVTTLYITNAEVANIDICVLLVDADP